ncbi:hypothetical protein [Companilactobacillus metriopterae]|uniref:hypothetical protein n=1 Tax=Companilactobacillus metriopterae TaxID=1909267 RepID=UPI00100BB988|nr:hypothetical protein [Companilactobacillus metriopterae]
MAQKGRKYKLLANTEWHATIAEKEQKKEAEILASDGFPLLKNTPPSYMSNAVKTEWKRIVPAFQLLPIRSLDRAMIEQYCVW